MNALLQALYGPSSDELDVADAEEMIGGMPDMGEADGNNDRVQGAQPAMETALNGAPESPEATAQGTGPNPTGQVLARLAPPKGSNPYDNSFGSTLAGGMAAVQPNMGKGSALAHGFVGGLSAGEAQNQKAALYDDAQQLKNLQALKTLFDMQRSSEQLKEAYRYHNMRAGAGGGLKPQFHTWKEQNELGEEMPRSGWLYPGQNPGQATGGGGSPWGDVAAGRVPQSPGSELTGRAKLDDAVKRGVISEADANLAEQMHSGAIDLPKGAKGAHLLKVAGYAYPDLDATTYPTRRQAYLQYGSTKITDAGGRIDSAQAVLKHLNEMSDHLEEISKHQGSNKLVNQVRNMVASGTGGEVGAWLKKQTGIDPKLSNALEQYAHSTTVATTELGRMYKGGVPAASEAKRELELMNPASPNAKAGLYATAKTIADVLDQRDAAWKSIAKGAKPPRDIWSDDAMMRMQTLAKRAGENFAPGGGIMPTHAGPSGGGMQSTPQGGGATPNGGLSTQQPVRVNSPAEARKLPSGTPIVLPDGSIGRVP